MVPEQSGDRKAGKQKRRKHNHLSKLKFYSFKQAFKEKLLLPGRTQVVLEEWGRAKERANSPEGIAWTRTRQKDGWPEGSFTTTYPQVCNNQSLQECRGHR